MKYSSSLLRLGCWALAVALFSSPVMGQSKVPTLVNYQAYLTDDVGNPLGTGAPISRKIWIKLYTSPTGGDPLHAEEQTALIFEGMLNTLIGQGAQIGTITFLPDLSLAFQHDELYIGLSVAESDGADPVSEITPRQRIVTTPYAFRARVAETIIDAAVDETQLAADAVTATKIRANAVGSAEIANDAVGATEIAANAVQASELANDSVDSAAIINGDVRTADLQDDAVTAAKIGDNAVNSSHIVDNSISANDIGANAIGSSELANDSVTASHLAPGAVDASAIGANSIGTSELGGALFYRFTHSAQRRIGARNDNTGLSVSEWQYIGHAEDLSSTTGFNVFNSGGNWVIQTIGTQISGSTTIATSAYFVRKKFLSGN